MASRTARSTLAPFAVALALALVAFALAPAASGQATIPMFRVYAIGQHLDGWNWTLGIPITLRIERGGATLGSVDAEPWDGGEYGGTFSIFLPTDSSPRLTVRFGDVVTATQGSVSKSTTVWDLGVSEVDLVADTVSGWAPPGLGLDVGAQGPVEGEFAYRFVEPGPDGSWTADFSVPADEGNPAYDLQPGVYAEANHTDPDADVSYAPYAPPSLRADAGVDRVWGFEWAAGAVTLEIDDPATVQDPDLATQADTTCRVLNYDQVVVPEDLPGCADGVGSTAVGFDLGAFDLRPGAEVRGSDAAGHEETIEVADIEVLEIRTDTSTLLARGPAGMQLAVFDALAIGWSDVEQVGDDEWRWSTYDPPCLACGMLGPGIDGVVTTDREASGTQVSWRVDDWPMEFYRLGSEGGSTWSERYLMWPLLDRVRTKIDGDGPYRLKREGTKRWSAWLDLDPALRKLETLLVRYGRGEVVLIDRTSGTTLTVKVVVVRP